MLHFPKFKFPYNLKNSTVFAFSALIAITHVTEGLATTMLYWMTRINNNKTVMKLFVNPNPVPKVASSLTNKKVTPTG
jgi:hypothetical protein